VYYYGFNLTKPPFAQSPKLRQALSMVIDRDMLMRSVVPVGELPAYNFVPPGTDSYTPQLPDYASWPMQKRVATAKQLLAESGFDPASGPIEIRFNTGEVHNKLAVAIASMWKQSLGIETRLHAEEFKVLLQDVDRAEETQVFRSSWVGDYNDANTFLQLFMTGFGINLPHYSNPQYDAHLKAAASELDPTRRRSELQAAERIMLEEQPIIPVYFYVNKHLVKPGVHGWYDNVMNVVYSKDLSL
jgi:oligopeptide transport system substrate-binding protein